MAVKFSNNASATLASAITAAATSVTVSAGQGALFPTLAAGEFFYGTLTDSSGNLEIIKVTARTGDTMTVQRGQDGTSARAYNAGDKLELRIVRAALDNKVDKDAPTFIGDMVISKAGPQVFLDKPASGTTAAINGRTNGKLRWSVSLGDDVAESGQNAGSSFVVERFDDNGISLGPVFTVLRDSGVIQLGGPLVAMPRNSTLASNDESSSIEVRNDGGQGDSGVAAIAFHCPGRFATKLALRSDGYFGVGGWSAQPWRWYVDTNTGNMTAAGNVIAYSDARMKENVEPIKDALDKVMRLRGVSFTRKDIAGRPRQIGVIAQEIREVVPEVVIETPDGTLGVAYGNLVALLIEAIKELAERMEDLECL